jgi:hypothetical protein
MYTNLELRLWGIHGDGKKWNKDERDIDAAQSNCMVKIYMLTMYLNWGAPISRLICALHIPSHFSPSLTYCPYISWEKANREHHNLASIYQFFSIVFELVLVKKWKKGHMNIYINGEPTGLVCGYVLFDYPFSTKPPATTRTNISLHI